MKKKQILEQQLVKNEREPIYKLQIKREEEGRFTILQERYLDNKRKFEAAMENYRKGTMPKKNKELEKPITLEKKTIRKEKIETESEKRMKQKREEILKRQIAKFLE